MPPHPMVFADVLAARLRRDAALPLVTFYDDSTGERVELSTTTYANWVAKAASLLTDEHGLERGDRLRVDLPAHWLTTVFLGAAWTAGLVVTDGADPDAVVCGPGTLAPWAPRAGDLPVLACSLRPLGVRFAEPVPAGVHDVGVEIWGQPDAYVAGDPPGGDDVAHDLGGGEVTHAELWSAANPASPPGIATLSEPLAVGGSLVLVVRADPARVEAIAVAERVTGRFPA